MYTKPKDGRREESIKIVLSPAEKRALELLAERDGGSQAGVLRRLLRTQAAQAGLVLSFDRHMPA